MSVDPDRRVFYRVRRRRVIAVVDTGLTGVRADSESTSPHRVFKRTVLRAHAFTRKTRDNVTSVLARERPKTRALRPGV